MKKNEVGRQLIYRQQAKKRVSMYGLIAGIVLMALAAYTHSLFFCFVSIASIVIHAESNKH